MNASDLYNDLVTHGFSLSAQGGNLMLSPSSRLSQAQRHEIQQHKGELLLLLAANENYEKIVVAQVEPLKNKVYSPRYKDLITCQQCEHLSLTGTCSQLAKRVIPEALRECDSFNMLKNERTPIEGKPHTQDELNVLLNQAARPLYRHLVDCQQCSLEDARYCVEGFGLGNAFDCLLLCFEDAATKRYELMNQVIKARVSGRMAFESLFSSNAPLQTQNAPITRKWGLTPQYEAFINHWTACKVCKPRLNRYCNEGKQLQAEAMNSYL